MKYEDMTAKQQRIYNNLIMLKALQDVHEETAIKVMSCPNLDGRELSEILEWSMLGHIKLQEKDGTIFPLSLNSEVTMAGIKNKMNQINIQSTGKPLFEVMEQYRIPEID